jgi:hypothetical protein
MARWRVAGLSRLGGWSWKAIPHKHGSHRPGIVAKSAQASPPEETKQTLGYEQCPFCGPVEAGISLKVGGKPIRLALPKFR